MITYTPSKSACFAHRPLIKRDDHLIDALESFLHEYSVDVTRSGMNQEVETYVSKRVLPDNYHGDLQGECQYSMKLCDVDGEPSTPKDHPGSHMHLYLYGSTRLIIMSLCWSAMEHARHSEVGIAKHRLFKLNPKNYRINHRKIPIT